MKAVESRRQVLARTGLTDYAQLAAAGCFETWGFLLDEAFELGLPAFVPDLGAIPPRVSERRAAVRRSALTRDGHVEAFGACSARAIEIEAGDLSLAVPTGRQAELLRLQRESAQARICPEGGPS